MKSRRDKADTNTRQTVASRRNATKLLAGAVGLGMGLGLVRKAYAAPGLVFEADGKTIASSDLPDEVARALLEKQEVSVLAEIQGSLYRANFKIEIEG